MVVLGGGLFLMSEAPLYGLHAVPPPRETPPQEIGRPPAQIDLTECTHKLVSESQLPQKLPQNRQSIVICY